MQKLYEVAGQVMGFFDAFKGSQPAIDNEKILIVRGRSRSVIPLDQFHDKINEIGELLGGKEVTSDKKIRDILELGDKHIQSKEEPTTAVDSHGFTRMKKELEGMGLVVEYKVFELPDCDVIIAIWEDKHELPPLYVEVTVSDNER